MFEHVVLETRGRGRRATSAAIAVTGQVVATGLPKQTVERIKAGGAVQAAKIRKAVRQWVYQPTLLNGDPVEVLAPIEVHFRLSN